MKGNEKEVLYFFLGGGLKGCRGGLCFVCVPLNNAKVEKYKAILLQKARLGLIFFLINIVPDFFK